MRASEEARSQKVQSVHNMARDIPEDKFLSINRSSGSASVVNSGAIPASDSSLEVIWIKFEGVVTKVRTQGCENVADLMKVIWKDPFIASRVEGKDENASMSVHLTLHSPALSRGLQLTLARRVL